MTITRAGSLSGNRDFRLLFAAAAVSRLGTSISYVAIPLVAVLALDATPGQVGLLATLSTVAFLLIGLPAGAWTDRIRRRGVLITADLARAALFGSVPLAWWLDLLTLAQLYVVVLLCGVGTVFFDVANQSYLPQVVGRPGLLAANTRLVSMDAAGDVAGRSLAGYLVALIGAPVAILVDALSYLVSALFVGRVSHREPAPDNAGAAPLWREMREGVRFVAGHPVLRAIATAGALSNLSVMLVLTMIPVLFVRELGLSEGVLGLFLAIGGAGMFLGSLIARRLAGRIGAGRVPLLVGVSTAPLGFLLPAVDRGAMLWLTGVAWLLISVRFGVDNVINVSFRQRITPDRLLGRMNATFRSLLTGALAIGAALAGLLGQLVDPRAALWAGAIGIAVVWVPIFLSPLRTMREFPG